MRNPPVVPIRSVYAIPKDRERRPDFEDGIRAALIDVQGWYAEQLGGRSFVMADPTPEICHMPGPESDYQSDDGWANVEAAVLSCVGLDEESVLVVHADVRMKCGEAWPLGYGTERLVIVHYADLEGLVTPNFWYCRIPWRTNRTIGGLAHELGHGFGLPHPPGCEEGSPSCDSESLMWAGYYDYPKTYLRPEEREQLMGSRYIRTMPLTE